MTGPDPVDDERRRRGRLSQDTVACTLGPVLDLSAGGMRVETSKVPRGTIEVQLFGTNEMITVKARVAWSKKIGLFKHEVGLEFCEMDKATKEKLTILASNNRFRRAL